MVRVREELDLFVLLVFYESEAQPRHFFQCLVSSQKSSKGTSCIHLPILSCRIETIISVLGQNGIENKVHYSLQIDPCLIILNPHGMIASEKKRKKRKSGTSPFPKSVSTGRVIGACEQHKMCLIFQLLRPVEPPSDGQMELASGGLFNFTHAFASSRRITA